MIPQVSYSFASVVLGMILIIFFIYEHIPIASMYQKRRKLNNGVLQIYQTGYQPPVYHQTHPQNQKRTQNRSAYRTLQQAQEVQFRRNTQVNKQVQAEPPTFDTVMIFKRNELSNQSKSQTLNNHFQITDSQNQNIAYYQNTNNLQHMSGKYKESKTIPQIPAKRKDNHQEQESIYSAKKHLLIQEFNKQGSLFKQFKQQQMQKIQQEKGQNLENLKQSQPIQGQQQQLFTKTQQGNIQQQETTVSNSELKLKQTVSLIGPNSQKQQNSPIKSQSQLRLFQTGPSQSQAQQTQPTGISSSQSSLPEQTPSFNANQIQSQSNFSSNHLTQKASIGNLMDSRPQNIQTIPLFKQQSQQQIQKPSQDQQGSLFPQNNQSTGLNQQYQEIFQNRMIPQNTQWPSNNYSNTNQNQPQSIQQQASSSKQYQIPIFQSDQKQNLQVLNYESHQKQQTGNHEHMNLGLNSQSMRQPIIANQQKSIQKEDSISSIQLNAQFLDQQQKEQKINIQAKIPAIAVSPQPFTSLDKLPSLQPSASTPALNRQESTAHTNTSTQQRQLQNVNTTLYSGQGSQVKSTHGMGNPLFANTNKPGGIPLISVKQSSFLDKN